VTQIGIDLHGRSALVTGAANGIGRAIAQTLVDAGARVAAFDRDVAGLAELHAGIGESRAAQVSTHQVDMTSVPQIRATVADVCDWCGGVDILVNNVGGSFGTPLRIDDVTEQDYDSTLSVNLKSAFFSIQSVLPSMRRRTGGSIVNVASISGRFGIPTISPQYSAAKAGVLGLTRNLAASLGQDNIRVNAVAPGYISSGARVDAIWNSRDHTPILAAIALHRRGGTAEVAAAVAFLASDAAAYVTGATLDVNGGLLCL
jgi:NAD(P)-dependent dehydrogenase (short-subunit alcohol dehydrogenase family)